MIRSKRNASGFTLVELLVLIVILGIVAAILVPGTYAETQSAAADYLQ